MKLIIFDIDGTLLSVDRTVTHRVVAGVLSDVHGYEGPLPEYDYAGRTDKRILLDLCELALCDSVGRLEAMEEALAENWRRHLAPENIRIHPGVRDLLARLAATEGVALGILTGNLEPAADLKLKLAGLDHFFSFGSYGSDALDRDDLPAIALDRARRVHAGDFDFRSAVVVGDSHRDIGCAKASGMRSLAVATGVQDLDYLTSFSPDAAVSTLLDADYLHTFISSR